MSEGLKYTILLLLCIGSRAATSINYIEDIDSLRFALSAIEFDVMKQQPHFPAYPFFCYLLNFLHDFIGNIGICFSIIGGFSIFLICFYMSKIAESITSTNKKWLLFITIFCHPFLWLMSNRYMPDILGLAILIAATFYLLKALKKQDPKTIIALSFLLGIECGVRLSYLPFFIPIFYLLKINKSTLPKLIIGFSAGLSIWLIPFILENNIGELITTGLRNTRGHFFEWGGTVNSNADPYFIRFAGFFRSIWADILNCWYPGRSILTIISSILWITLIVISFKRFISKSLSNKIKNPIIMCLIFYSLWIFFFQNIVYKPRHIIPLIPFVLLFIFLILEKKGSNLFISTIVILIIILNSITCFKLVNDHLSPSAISQSKDWIENNYSKNWVFCSIRLKNFYFKKQIDPKELKFINIEDKLKLIKEFTSGKTICTDQNLDNVLLKKPSMKQVFFHNPNVNRLWSKVTIRTYHL